MRSTNGADDDAGRKSDAWVRFYVPHAVDAGLAALAAAQHAVFHLDQVCELGLSARAIQRRAATGRLHRIHHAVYSLVPAALLGRDGRFMAAVLACGPDAVLSYRSAAALLELRRTERTNVDVTIPGRSPRKHRGIDVHRSTTLSPADTVRVRNIPCTTVSRTLLDLSQVVNRRGVERACDQADILELLNGEGLIDQIERNARRPASRRLRGALDDHYLGSTPTWSELEEAFLALCRAAGVPPPEVNAWIAPDDGEPAIRADFVWREHRLVVETDGHQTHRTRQAFEQDRRRDQRLTVAGWIVIRTTWRQVTQSPHQVATTILALLRL